MRTCDHCNKGSMMAGTRKLLRGHYNPTNWSRKKPNLQKARDKEGKRVTVCTKCLKVMTGKKKTRTAAKKEAKAAN